MKKIHLSPGFRVELAAAEPLTIDPVAIDWDVSGRMWVVEMADYPLGIDGKGKPGGRVRVLEDTDGDGRYDKSTLFADGLNFPTGIAAWRDGVIVTAAPEILFLRDTDGDGRADLKRVLFSGFLEGNQQLRINGLRWGLDNWIYCAVGGHYRGYGAATKIKSALTGEETALGSRDFRFRPDTGEFEPASGPAQFGRNRDDWGHWFGTQNSNPLWHYVLQDHYLRRNPHVPAPDPANQVIRPMNPRVFPASPNEKRYHSFEHADRFTSACSGTIYRDTLLFGASSEMHAFVCEPFHNLVHHEIVTDDGVTFQAHRSDVEQTSEFFASEDRWSRPVMIRTGPDGALWVVDMYRYMIEHPDWLPPEGREELLPFYREGDDKGRIYRVLPKDAPSRKVVRLDRLSTSELVAALDSSNEWQRDKAQQLLLWRNDRAAAGPLEALATQNKNALARLHALCALDGLGALQPSILITALSDEAPGVRENALRLAEKFNSPDLIHAAATLASDPSAKVRLQLACSLGAWTNAEAGEALGNLARRDHGDAYILAAVMSSAIPHAQALAKALLAENGPPLQAYSEAMYTLALGLEDLALLLTLLEPALAPKDGKFNALHFARYAAFLRLANDRKANVDNLPSEKILLAAREGLRGAGPDQFAAASLLARNPKTRGEAMPILATRLKPSESLETQRAAISALAETGDASVPDLLLQNWPAVGPETRLAILETLLRREAWAYALLKNEAVAAGDFDASRRNRLLKYDSARVRELASNRFSQPASPNRTKVIEEFKPALQLTGDPAHGKEIYGRTCIVCHRRDGQGNDIGPDLRSVVEHPPEKLLTNILDPSLDVQPGYHAYNCALTNGEELYGLISAETATSVIFKFADGTMRTISRKEINTLRSSNLSLMPDGLENGLSKQDLADLIAFLRAR
jgi:putative membrane-bound dehydrogenase-like protein